MVKLNCSQFLSRRFMATCIWIGLALCLMASTQAQTPFSQEQKLVTSNINYLRENNALAIDGNTAVIGEPNSDGNVNVYVRQGNGWALQTKISTLFMGTWSGISVAISGNTIVVGAVGRGEAYVYVRSGSVWTFQQKLIPTQSLPADQYGSAVAISGNTIAIGAYRENSERGAAYTYVRTGTVWTMQQRLTATDGASGDFFGRSVALSGNTVIVGAYGSDLDLSHVNQGAAYVFNRTGTSWSEPQKLYAVDGEAQDLFGRSVAIHNDTLVIGATGTNLDLSHLDQGVAHVFKRIGGSWLSYQKLYLADGQAGDFFGRAVAVNGATIVVTHIGRSGVPGVASVWVESGGNWIEQQRLSAQDANYSDGYGSEVAIGNNSGILNGGNSILVSSFLDSVVGYYAPGAVYAYSNVCPSIAVFPSLPIVNPVNFATVQAGTIARNEQIATMLQPGCAPAGTLSVSVINHTPGDFTISNVVNQNGFVSADFAVSCAVLGHTISYTLVVSNGSRTVQKRLYVPVIANVPPYFVYRNSPYTVSAGGNLAISGSPFDNGTIIGASVSSPTFTGNLSVDTTGKILVGAASPVGTHDVNITLMDQCGATNSESLQLVVTAP